MERETFVDHLFWFYQFKREYLKYQQTQKKMRLEYIEDLVAYFVAIRPHEEKFQELGDKTLNEIRQALAELQPAKVKAYLQEIQNFLDKVYDCLDVDYATTDDRDPIGFGFPSTIPKIQNLIRAEYIQRFEKRQNSNSVADSLSSLFKNTKTFLACVDALREVDPPLIGEDNNFLGKNKSGLVLWVRQMLSKDLIEHRSDKQYASLLSTYFTNLTINEATFRAKNPRATALYKSDFRALLSQVSQSVE